MTEPHQPLPEGEPMNRLDQIEARANAATEGPWEAHGTVIDAYTGPGDCSGCSGILSPAHEPACYYSEIAGAGDIDAEFIAHARQDVSDMVAAFRAILDLHKRQQNPTGDYCNECFPNHWNWPCPTVTAVTTALNKND